jgi:hypothetical protein
MALWHISLLALHFFQQREPQDNMSKCSVDLTRMLILAHAYSKWMNKKCSMANQLQVSSLSVTSVQINNLRSLETSYIDVDDINGTLGGCATS